MKLHQARHVPLGQLADANLSNGRSRIPAIRERQTTVRPIHQPRPVAHSTHPGHSVIGQYADLPRNPSAARQPPRLHQQLLELRQARFAGAATARQPKEQLRWSKAKTFTSSQVERHCDGAGAAGASYWGRCMRSACSNMPVRRVGTAGICMALYPPRRKHWRNGSSRSSSLFSQPSNLTGRRRWRPAH